MLDYTVLGANEEGNPWTPLKLGMDDDDYEQGIKLVFSTASHGHFHVRDESKHQLSRKQHWLAPAAGTKDLVLRLEK